MSDLATRTALLAPVPHRPDGRATLRHTARDLGTMVGRSLRLSRRNVDALIMSIVLPVLLMLIFVYLFGGAINTGGEYVNYVVPGVILLCAGFGAATTAVSVTNDLSEGVIDRFRSMDVPGAAVINGHVIASLLRNLVSTLVVIGVALAIGFRPRAGALDWLAALGVVALWILAISWLSAAMGTLARSPEAASGFTFFVSFLPYLSSAFVPVETMPAFLRPIAEHQPVTPVSETVRGMLMDIPVGSSPGLAVVWCLGLTAVSILLCSWLFRRRTAA